MMKVKPKKKRRRRQPTALAERMRSLATEILSATISGLISAAILKLLGW